MSFEQSGDEPQRDMSDGDVNQRFADIVSETEDQARAGEPVTIIRPDGKTETTFTDPDGGLEVTLTSMPPEARAAALAEQYAEIQARYGRTDNEQAALKAKLNDASALFQAAMTEERRMRQDEPGSAAQLAALKARDNAHDAFLAANSQYYDNKFEPIVRYTPDGAYVNGVLQADEAP